MRGKRALIFLFVLCCTALLAVPSRSEQNRTETITGTFVAMSGSSSGRSRPFRLTVNRYTPTNQVRELNEALSRGGQDELLKAMSNMDAGRVQIGTGVGVPANAVIVDPWGEGGRRIVVLYERFLRFFELRYGTRSRDYPIGYAEIFLDRNNRGEGTLIPAARVRLKDGNTWEVEDFGVFPARLMVLRSTGPLVPR